MSRRRNRSARRLRIERLEARQAPAVLIFQPGIAYSGLSDTAISALAPDTPQPTAPSLTVQTANLPTAQALLRFDQLFGSGPNQIPAGSTIESASLTIWVDQGNLTSSRTDSRSGVRLHRMMTAWDPATATWTSFSANGQPGIQTDGIEAAASADGLILNATPDGYVVIGNLAPALSAWSAGANHGWVLSAYGVVNGWMMASSESGTPAHRPILTVQFTPPSEPPPPTYQQLAGIPPSPMRMEWFSWQTTLETQRLGRVPSERAATFYFAQNGNDLTGTGEIDRPWKSLAKAQAVLDASSGDVRLRFRRGDVWTESSVLNVARSQVTIDDYGSAALGTPVFSRFTRQYVGGWSYDPSLLIWYRTETTPIGWLRRSSDPEAAFLYRASSAAEASTRMNSWYYDAAAGRLYYQTPSDPNSVALAEAALDDAQGWSVTGRGVRIQNVQIQGSGIKADGSGVGLCIAPGAGGEFVGVNVAVTWSGGRGIVVAGSGAVATLIGCSAGLLINRGGTGAIGSGDVTPFDIDGGTGGNELMMRDCVVYGGALPSSDWGARIGDRHGRWGVFQHTNGPALPPALSIALQTKYPDRGWQVAGGTHVFGPSVTTIDDVRAYIVGESPADGIDSIPGLGSGDRAYVNNVYTHLTIGRSIGAETAQYFGGVYASWVVNTTVRVDATQMTPTDGAWTWYRSAAPLDIQFENSRLEVAGPAAASFELVPTDAALGTRFRIRNSILATSGFGQVGLGAALAANRLDHNAYAITPLPAGITTVDPAGTILDAVPDPAHVPAAGLDLLYGGGAVTSLNFDQYGILRDSQRNDIGPAVGANITTATRRLPYTNLPNVGTPPSPDDPAWFAWQERLVSARLANVPLNRSTTYYFSQDGNDLVGDGSPGNPFRTLQWANGIVAKSYSARVDWWASAVAPDLPEFNSSGRDFTVAFWGRLQNVFYSIVAQRPGAWNLGFPDNQRYGIWTGIAGQTVVDSFVWPTFVSNGWNYFAAGYSAATGELRLSVNGQPWITKPAADPGNGFAPFQLFDQEFFARANLSDFGYWSSTPGGGGALSNADIATMYRSGQGRRYEEVPPALRSNLVAFWTLDEPSYSTTFADRTGRAPLATSGGLLRQDGRPLGDVRLRFQGGDTWREDVSLSINRPNVTVDSFGQGSAYFTRFTESYTSGWQLVSGNLWKRVQPKPVGWLRPAADPLSTIYKLNNTTALVAAQDQSFFYDKFGADPLSGGQPTLYFNPGAGVNPNLVPGGFESAPFNDGWSVTTDNVRIENIRVHGAGLSQVGTGQSGYGLYVFHSVQGFAEFVGVDLEFLFTGYHAFGHISDGTSMVLINCRGGLCTNRDGTGQRGSGDTIPFVSFAGAGNQEFVMVDCEVPYGTLPSWDWDARPGDRHSSNGVYTHTNGGAFVPRLSIAVRTRYPDNPWQVIGGTQIFGPVVQNLKDVRAYIVGEAPADGIDSIPGFGYNDRVYVNNTYTHLIRKPSNSAIGIYYGPALASWAINTTVRVDGSDWLPSSSGRGLYFGNGGLINVRLINCRFEIVNNNGDVANLIQPYLGYVGSNFLLQNSIVSVSGVKGGGLGPIGSGQISNNAYYFQVTNPAGTNTYLDPAPVYLSGPPRDLAPSLGSPLYRAGAVGTLGFDQSRKPRGLGRADIGPRSAAPIPAPIEVLLETSVPGVLVPVEPIISPPAPIARVIARFSQEADIGRWTLRLLTAIGQTAGVAQFSYNAATFTGTWTLAQPISDGSFRLNLDTSYSADFLLQM